MNTLKHPTLSTSVEAQTPALNKMPCSKSGKPYSYDTLYNLALRDPDGGPWTSPLDQTTPPHPLCSCPGPSSRRRTIWGTPGTARGVGLEEIRCARASQGTWPSLPARPPSLWGPFTRGASWRSAAASPPPPLPP
eukprot:1635315-Pyramimonas_sp.AAC.1